MLWWVTTGGTSVMSKRIGRICWPSPSDDSGRCAGVLGCACSGCGVRAVRGSCVCGGCSVGVCTGGVEAGGVFSTRCRGGFGCCPKIQREKRTTKLVRIVRIHYLAGVASVSENWEL